MEAVKAIPQVVNDIRDALIAHFGANLATILLYGSCRREESFWDLDMLVIFADRSSVIADLSFIRKIVADFSEHELDLQVFYASEVASADTFSLDAHGAFFSRILADATILYGENPFTRFAPTEEIIITSLLNRIQRYLFQQRQEYIGIGRYVRDKNPKYHRKHARRVLMDFMLMFGSCVDDAQAEELFKKRFPGAFSDAEWALLASDSDDVADYMELYEKIYNLAVEASRMLLPRENRRPSRATLDGMVFEYLLPKSYTEAVIIVDGLPRIPELKACMNLLVSWGYAVFFPRLKGSWESEGTFLDHDPTDDVRGFARAVKRGIIVRGETIRADNVTVLGTSFGGLVALGASIDTDVARSIAVSPVYAMSAVAGIETFGPFVKEMYGGAYRYVERDWQRFIDDEIFSLGKIASNPAFDPAKCTVIAGEHDTQVDITGLRDACMACGIAVHALPVGHMTLHRDLVMRPLLYRLLRNRA